MRRALAFSVVFGQLALLVALVLLPHGSLWPANILVASVAIVLGIGGAVIAVLGVARLGPALTASPIPREEAPLMTSGVYSVVRNPIYSGLMIGGACFALFGASAWHIAAWIALLLLLSGKTRWEERMLIAKYSEYAEYAARVGRFVPGVGRLRH